MAAHLWSKFWSIKWWQTDSCHFKENGILMWSQSTGIFSWKTGFWASMGALVLNGCLRGKSKETCFIPEGKCSLQNFRWCWAHVFDWSYSISTVMRFYPWRRVVYSFIDSNLKTQCRSLVTWDAANKYEKILQKMLLFSSSGIKKCI